MMAERMGLAKARQIAQEIAVALAKHGAQLRPPYKNYEIVEALVTLETALSSGTNAAVQEAKDLVTAANRRAGAAEARLARLVKRTGKTAVELDGQDDIG